MVRATSLTSSTAQWIYNNQGEEHIGLVNMSLILGRQSPTEESHQETLRSRYHYGGLCAIAAQTTQAKMREGR
jgi:hypothetical protein